MKKSNQGFAQILLVILALAIVGLGVVLFIKSQKESAPTKDTSEVGTTEERMETAEESGLEEELNSEPLSDPSEDFKSVDADIISL